MSLLSINLDLLRCIDQYLAPLDIIRLSITCGQLYRIFSENFWYRRLVRDYPEEVACPMTKYYKKWYYDLYYLPLGVREICEKGEEEYQQLLKVVATLNSCSRQEFVTSNEEDEDGLPEAYSIIFTSRIWPIPVVKSTHVDNVFTHRHGAAFVEIMYRIDKEANVAYYIVILSQQGEYYVTLSQLALWLSTIKITHRPVPSPVSSYSFAKEHPRYFKIRQ